MLEGGPIGNHQKIYPCLLFTDEVTEASLAGSGSLLIHQKRQTENSTLEMMGLGGGGGG